MSAREPLPAALAARSDRDDVLDDVESARALTAADRERALVSLCRMAAELIAQQPDSRRALEWQDPIPAESELLLRRLRAAYRAGNS